MLVVLDGAGSLTQDALVQQQVDGHVVPTATAARATIDDLLATGLLAPADASAADKIIGDEPRAALGARVAITDDGRLARTSADDEVYRPGRDAVARITPTLYGDLPAGDVETTRRTLGEVARRAGTLLAAADGPGGSA